MLCTLCGSRKSGPPSTLKKFCAARSLTPSAKPKMLARRWKRLRPAPMGRAFRYQKRTAHLWVGVAEHHVAAAERVAAIEAETEAQKGVRGTARRVRKALTGKQGGRPKKGKKK